MAGSTIDRRTKQLQQAAGLTTLHTGVQTTPAMMAEHTDIALRYQVQDLQLFIDENVDMATPQEEPGFFASLFSFGEEPARETIGTKDHLQQLIDRQLANEALAPHEVTAVKAAMSVAAYDVDLSQDTFSADELGALGRFNTSLDNNQSLTQIANFNFQTAEENERLLAAQAEAAREAAEREELAAQQAAELEQQSAMETAELNAKVSSMLVYGGYLPAEHANNTVAVAHAMKNMMTIVTPHQDLVDEEKKIFANFEDWSVTPYALTYLTRHLPNIAPQNELRDGDLLASHLQSGNPELIKIAQGYLAVTNPDIQVNGFIDQVTLDAANTSMRAPLTMPENLIAANGSVRIDNMMEMAVRGQLYLPLDQLTEEERAVAMSYPLAADREPHQTMSREKFAALRLISDDPERYEAILAAENARRANATLEVEFDVPAVVVPEGTPIIEEAVEIAQNPAMLAPVENNDAVTDAAQPIVDYNVENATGVTTQSHILVFEGQEIALGGIVEALILDRGAYGDGNADNMISMTGAINLVRGAVSVNDQMGFSIPLSPDDVAAVNASLGYEPNHRFDVTQPHDMAALLQGVTTYQNVKAAGVPFTDEFIQENTTINHPEVSAAINQASGVTPQPVAPEAPAPSPDSMTGPFRGAALGVEVMKPDDPALSPDRRMAANLSGGPLPMVS